MQGVQSQAPSVQTGTLVDLGDTSATPEVNGQGAVPSSSSTGKPSDEDFDMFAQSRQSFEQNLPRAKYVTRLCVPFCLHCFLYCMYLYIAFVGT